MHELQEPNNLPVLHTILTEINTALTGLSQTRPDIILQSTSAQINLYKGFSRRPDGATTIFEIAQPTYKYPVLEQIGSGYSTHILHRDASGAIAELYITPTIDPIYPEVTFNGCEGVLRTLPAGDNERTDKLFDLTLHRIASTPDLAEFQMQQLVLGTRITYTQLLLAMGEIQIDPEDPCRTVVFNEHEGKLTLGDNSSLIDRVTIPFMMRLAREQLEHNKRLY